MADEKMSAEIFRVPAPFPARALSIEDLCYNAFMTARSTNDEDGGPTDWMTDTKPKLQEFIDAFNAHIATLTSRALKAEGEVERMRLALLLTEASDLAHGECEECGGECAPEECGVCFELADPARVARRAALGLPDIIDAPMEGETLDQIAQRVSAGRFGSMRAILDATAKDAPGASAGPSYADLKREADGLERELQVKSNELENTEDALGAAEREADRMRGALEEAERLYSASGLLANDPTCGNWINRTRDVLKRAALSHQADGADMCDCADRAKPGEYYLCPKCDAEWLPDDEGSDAV